MHSPFGAFEIRSYSRISVPKLKPGAPWLGRFDTITMPQILRSKLILNQLRTRLSVERVFSAAAQEKAVRFPWSFVLKEDSSTNSGKPCSFPFFRLARKPVGWWLRTTSVFSGQPC